MLKSKKLSLAILASLIFVPPHTAVAGALEDAITDGTASINARYRYGAVDDSVNKDAKASTLRTRLGFTTADKLDLSAHMDFEHVTRAGPPDYNSTQNGQTDYAKVVDPDEAELNQTYLKYSDYSADAFSQDTSKIWLQLTMNLQS